MVPKIVTLRLIVITPEEACKLCVHLCISTWWYDDEHWMWSNLRRRPPLLHAHSWVQVVQPRWGLVGDEIIHGRVRKPRRSSTASIDPVYLRQVQTKPLRRWSSTFVNHPRRHNLQEAQELEKDWIIPTSDSQQPLLVSFELWTCVFQASLCFSLSYYKFCSWTVKHPQTNKHSDMCEHVCFQARTHEQILNLPFHHCVYKSSQFSKATIQHSN